MIGLSRRSFIGSAALVVSGASAPPLARFAFPESVIPANRFFESVGICTHPNWRKTLWGSSDWEAAFLGTGVMYTRGKIASRSTGKAALSDLQKLFARGVKICVTIAEPADAGFDFVATKRSLDFLANEVGAENLCGIESANEYNNPRSRPSDWALKLRTFQKWLHATVRANPAFDDVPLIAPSIWGRLTNDYFALGNLEQTIDRGCIHYYTGGRRPTKVGVSSASGETGGRSEQSLAEAIRDARIIARNKRLWMTEFGYPIAGANAVARGFVTEETAAKYLIRGLFDIFGEGVEKVFIYTLIDDVHRSPPRYHGLLDGALQPRRTFYALKNLMALFADVGVASPAGRLTYSHSAPGGKIKRQLFQKSDGTFLLCVYQDVDSYDRVERRDIKVQPLRVSLRFPKEVSEIEVFTPTYSPIARERVHNTDALTTSVGDHVTVLKITPR